MPVFLPDLLISKGTDNILNGRRREVGDERYALVQLIDHTQHAGLSVDIRLEIRTETRHVAILPCLEPQEQGIVGIQEQDRVFLLVGEQRHHDVRHIRALLIIYVDIFQRGLHGEARRHITSFLVVGVTYVQDILNQGSQFDVTTLFQPLYDASAVEIMDSQLLIGNQHGHQFLHVLSNQVALGVNHEALIAQER